MQIGLIGHQLLASYWLVSIELALNESSNGVQGIEILGRDFMVGAGDTIVSLEEPNQLQHSRAVQYSFLQEGIIVGQGLLHHANEDRLQNEFSDFVCNAC